LTEAGQAAAAAAAAVAHDEGKAATEPEDHSAMADELEESIATLMLSPSEQQSKMALLDEGFSEWTRKDFRAFTSALELFGRRDTEVS
jgi:hypothetical protein